MEDNVLGDIITETLALAGVSCMYLLTPVNVCCMLCVCMPTPVGDVLLALRVHAGSCWCVRHSLGGHANSC